MFLLCPGKALLGNWADFAILPCMQARSQPPLLVPPTQQNLGPRLLPRGLWADRGMEMGPSPPSCFLDPQAASAFPSLPSVAMGPHKPAGLAL